MAFFTKKRIFRGVLIVILAALVYFGYANREYVQQIPIGSGAKAKLICSGVFVSGRDPAVVEAEDTGFHPLFKLFKTDIDSTEKSVTVSVPFLGMKLFKKKAVFIDRLGAVLLDGVSEATVRGWNVTVPPSEPSNPAAVLWPTGDLMPADPSLPTVDAAKLAAALDRTFSEPDPKHLRRTRAMIIVHNGRIVAERYGSGIAKDTRLISWSMGKSVTSALIGILAGQGKLNIKDPAPVPEWASPADPRHAITVDELLRMSPGLEWYEAYAEHPVSDVNKMLFLKPDMAAFAAAKPLSVPPDTKFEYSTGTTLILSRIIRQVVGNQAGYWAFPRTALFNRIGMRSAIAESDGSGTFVSGAFIYAAARDYARFGLLYLNDGVWQGERILPDGWVAYTTTPSPTAKRGDYGAQFWLNKGPAGHPEKREFPKLPEDLFMAQGYQGQAIIIIPSRKIVVVRLGMTYEDNWGMGKFLEDVLAVIK